VRRHAVALEGNAELPEREEGRIERVHRLGAGQDDHLGAGAPGRLDAAGDRRGRGAEEERVEERGPEPAHFFAEYVAKLVHGRLAQRLLDHRADPHREEGPHLHQPAGVARRALTLSEQRFRQHERRDLGAGDGLAAVDDLSVVEGVDAQPLQPVHAVERFDSHAEHAPALRGERPVAPRERADLDAVTGGGRRDPGAGIALVDVVGVGMDDVELTPLERQEGRGVGGGEALPFPEAGASVAIAQVVTEHRARQPLGAGVGAHHPLGLHRAAAGARFFTAVTWAMMLNAISALDSAPNCKPIGRWMRASSSSV
jgi:hypothetical protein